MALDEDLLSHSSPPCRQVQEQINRNNTTVSHPTSITLTLQRQVMMLQPADFSTMCLQQACLLIGEISRRLAAKHNQPVCSMGIF